MTDHALDEIRLTCEQFSTKQWAAELAPRLKQPSRRLPDDRGMMHIFAVAIAYSQNARSKQVSVLIETDEFRRAFADFDPAKLARMKPASILERHWAHLSSMRFRGKVRADLRQREMPFFRSTTSLLQLLLDLDFDSVKPDLIVMRLARRIGLVERELGEPHFRAATKAIQRYAIERGLRARSLDLAMLAFGGQTGTRDLLSRRFCPPFDPCGNASCPLAGKLLCKAFTKCP